MCNINLFIAILIGSATMLHAAESNIVTQLIHQDIAFTHGTNHLEGTLVLPPKRGPHPLVIFIHGSGPASRDGYTMYPSIQAHFANKGIASFAWDKPGVGKSTGTWKDQTMRVSRDQAWSDK